MRKSNILLAIGLVLLIIALIGMFAPKTIGPTKNPTRPSSIATAFCSPSDIKATVAFEGAAGTIYGNFTITDISASDCQIISDQFINLVYNTQVKNIAIAHNGIPQRNIYILHPNISLYALVRIPNGPQCSSQIKPVSTSYTYQIADNTTITFKDATNNQQFTINACSKPSEITTVNLSPWSDTPIVQ